MNWFILTLAIGLIVAYPFFVHEHDRYMLALDSCYETHIKNQHTLAQDACVNIDVREKCSESMRTSCLAAERENRISPRDCARRKWLIESEAVAVYMRLAGSTWTLLALAIVTILGAMYFYAQFKMVDSSNRRMVDAFGGMFQDPRRLKYRY